MDVDRRVFLERAAGSEAGWSSGAQTAVNLPDLKEGEFEHVAKSADDESLKADMDAVFVDSAVLSIWRSGGLFAERVGNFVGRDSGNEINGAEQQTNGSDQPADG